MYKKMLFLMILMPLTHSTIYSMDTMAKIGNRAKESFLKTAISWTILAAPVILRKEPSATKEAALPLLTTIMVASGVSGLTSILSDAGSVILSIMGCHKPARFLNDKNKYIAPLIGSAIGLSFYYNKDSIFK